MALARRYRIAQAMGNEELLQAIKEDTKLLAEFGLRLLSVEGGVQAAIEDEVNDDRINPWNVLFIDGKTWDWLRPILVQAQKRKSESAAAFLAAAK